MFRDYESGRFSASLSGIQDDYYNYMRGNQAEEKYLLETVFHTNYTDSSIYLRNQNSLAKAILDDIAQAYKLKLR